MKKTAAEPIVINGAMGEGGGALLRTAVALSCMTQQPIRLHNVRGAKRKKGLTAEDLALIGALETSTQAVVEGSTLDSELLIFAPTRPAHAITHRLDVSSFQQGRVPGCAPILASCLAPVLTRTGAYASLTLCGETHANNALSYDSFERSTIHAWRSQGLYTFPSLRQTGFGFGARGEMVMEIEPSGLQPIDWSTRGELKRMGAVVTCTEVAEPALERCMAMVRSKLHDAPVEVSVDLVTVHGKEPGLSVCFWAEFERGVGSGSAVLQRGMNVQTAVDRAYETFSAWFSSSSTVDSFLADQLLLPAVQTIGRTTYTTQAVTRRLLTMVMVVKRFLPIKVTVLGHEGEPGTVTIDRQS